MLRVANSKSIDVYHLIMDMVFEREKLTLVGALPLEASNADLDCLDPRLGAEAERFMPTEDLNEVQISPLAKVARHCLDIHS